ncbi:MAG: hypothetical protein DRJ42_00335 [Deltaproteobacteria bacterium]|nr:MAG: hypothetical protein DRJ42_00335 [Deltaproteobacteria bacterium]
MRAHFVLFLTVIAALFTLPAAEAAAQRVVYQQPAEQPQMGPVTVSNAPPSQRDPDRIRTWGQVDFGSPIFYDVDSDVVRPGFNFDLRGGILKNFFGGFMHAGASWNNIDLEHVPGWAGYGNDSLKRLYFGFGGRLMYAEGKVKPYVDLAIDFNFWNFRETSYGCGYWYCSTYDHYRFALGWSSRAGIQIAINEMIAIDLGVSFEMSYAGDFFDRTVYWMTPSAGISMFR